MLAWGHVRNPSNTHRARLWFQRALKAQEQDFPHASACSEDPGSAQSGRGWVGGAKCYPACHRHPTCLPPVTVAGRREDRSLLLGTVNKSGTELAAEGPSPGL